ncbi:MAG: NAD(P)H-quinone oxidoreductase subunit 3, chloroplastic [Phycisphaerae bacterium]|nr:NAD(P)H-quinone oxidoreductase subunit 3, chloroplastic [Phycisphaerae bacterium]
MVANVSASAGPVSAWGPVVILLALAVVFGVGMVALSSLVGRRVRGPVKDAPYESGVEPVGDARRRFNIRYYLLGITFLLFDVEVVLLFPWAVIFGRQPWRPDAGAMLITAGVFVLLILVGYLYEWRRGALRFD